MSFAAIYAIVTYGMVALAALVSFGWALWCKRQDRKRHERAIREWGAKWREAMRPPHTVIRLPDVSHYREKEED